MTTAIPKMNQINGLKDDKVYPLNKELYVTYVDALGPYLRISGQLNRNTYITAVQQRIQTLLAKCQTIQSDWPVAAQLAALIPGKWCIYKLPQSSNPIVGNSNLNNEYQRARIVRVVAGESATAAQVSVQADIELVDNGGILTIAGYELMLPDSNEHLDDLPSMCSQFIMLGICEDWNTKQLNDISQMICHHTLGLTIQKEFMQNKFVTMKWKEFDLAEYLILQKKFGAPIDNELLFKSFAKLVTDKQQPQQLQQSKPVANNNRHNLLKNQSTNSQPYQLNSKSNILENDNNDKDNKDRNNNSMKTNKTSTQIPTTRTTTTTNTTTATTEPSFPKYSTTSRLSARLKQLQYPGLYQQQQQQQQIHSNIPSYVASGYGMNSVNRRVHPHHGYVQNFPNMMLINGGGPSLQPCMPQTIGNVRSIMHVYNRLHYQMPQTQLHPLAPTAAPIANYVGGYPAMMPPPPLTPSQQPFTATTHIPPHINHYGSVQQRVRPSNVAFAANNVGNNLLLSGIKQSSSVASSSSSTSLATASAPVSPIKRTVPATFRSNVLTVNQTYDVSVSFVENGPFLFSIQLISAQNDLTDMMNRLEKVGLHQFVDKPTVGTACIARYSEDGQLYRALITGIYAPAYKVAYIDYGNAEMVQYDDIYEIPDEFLEHKAFAMRFTLSGHKELEPIDESLKKTFKDLVIYKNCKLKVMPLDGPPLVQYCELYMKEKNILDELKEIQKSRLVYDKAEPLVTDDVVEIRFIESPKNFYVQKVKNITAFERLMDDMYLFYNINQVVPQKLTLGAPCIVKCDNEWYRAEIMRADSAAIIVRHVDFGYEQTVTKNLLSTIAPKHLNLPRQAVQCCLKGFENNELIKDTVTTQFEMLAEETNRERRAFTVKVFRIQPDGVNLVNLSANDLNVMKKLYKLSMPFEQYLSFEKENFNNIVSLRSNKTTPTKTENNKSLSLTSSSGNSSDINKTATILNSTILQSEESNQEMRRVRQTPKELLSQNPYSVKRSILYSGNRIELNSPNSGTIEWDKQSAPSSKIDNLSSPSSSTDFRQLQIQTYNKRSNQSKSGMYGTNRNYNSSSANSFVSDKRSSGSSSSYNGRQTSLNSNIPPRLQRQQQQQHNQYQPFQQNPKFQASLQRSLQRPQNAPQGYSQQKQQQQQHHHYRQQAADNQGRMQPLRHNKKSNVTTGLLTATQTSSSSNSSIINDYNSSLPKCNNVKVTESKLFLEMPTPIEYVPLDHNFPIQRLEVPFKEEVTISWWISPHQFYTQLKSRLNDFEQFMQRIQTFYRSQSSSPSSSSSSSISKLQLKVGSHVMALHRKDNIIYRARIMASNQILRKYKVHFVDYGNQYAVSDTDIWQVERRFVDFPIMAYLSGFANVISNYDHLYIIDRMDRYLPYDSVLQCEYQKRLSNDLYQVNIDVNGTSLEQTLCNEGLITKISNDIRLELLANQQLRAKIISIRDMLNFKIRFSYDCDSSTTTSNMDHIDLLCSYDDMRYVKSNNDIANKFKKFYLNKSVILNIKDVNDNKVILARPLLPLLKEDIPWYICSMPLLCNSLKVRIVYVASPARLYGQTLKREFEKNQLLDDMYGYYENNGDVLTTIEVGHVCAAKGIDGNWYRSRILSKEEKCSPNSITVYYIDYGNTEVVEKQYLKKLVEEFYVDKNAFAVEINLPMKTKSSAAAERKQQQQQQRNKGRKRIGAIGGSNELDLSTDPLDPTDVAVINFLTKITLDIELTVKPITFCRNHLIADLLMRDGTNIIDLLQKDQLIHSRNLDHMRKLLDIEKPNMLEFIETVDLTVEDEDERQGLSVPSTLKKWKIVERIIKAEALDVKSANDANLNDDNAANQEELKAVSTVTIAPLSTDSDLNMKIGESLAPINGEADIQAELQAEEQEQQLNPVSIENATTEETPVCLEPVNLEPPVISNPYAGMQRAVLAHCDSPAQFFIHTMDKLRILEHLQQDLQIVASSFPQLKRIKNGTLCVSMYSVDKQWYRSKILDAELMVLQFIDFGNTDCVTDTSHLRDIFQFSEVEPLCIPCALPIQPNDTLDWVDAANTIFNDSYNKILNFDYIIEGSANKTSYINLYIEDVNVTEKLIQDGYAKPLQFIDDGENCYISHVNSINDFYIQYEKDSKALELFEIYLSDFTEKPKLEKFESGKVVAALFPDDNMWYRAKLLKELNDGYQVMFIDFGNTSVSLECREISKEIAEWQPLSKKCALKLPEDFLGWSEQAESKFHEIAATGETIFTIKLCQPAADHAIVDLLIDGRNINLDLEAYCEKKPTENDEEDHNNTSYSNSTVQTSIHESGILRDAIVSHINSPCDFYLQFIKDTIRLEDITLSLNTLTMEISDQPIVGDLYAVKHEDNAYYRGKLLDIIRPTGETGELSAMLQYRILFVDFGNETVSTELRVLPHDLSELKVFSKRCQLENAVTLAHFGRMAIETFTDLVNKCDYKVKVDIIDDEPVGSDCSIVKLYTANGEENICQKLNKLLGLDNNASISFANYSVANESGSSNADVLIDTPRTCMITHAVAPVHFYIQLKENSDKMDFVKHTLQNELIIKKMATIEIPALNVLGVVYSTEDNCYYRGRVDHISEDDRTLVVFLLDFGNSITVERIREMPEAVATIEPLAWHCQLNSIPTNVNDLILEESFSALIDAHFGEVYEIESIELCEKSKIYTVKLQVNYQDVAEQLATIVEQRLNHSEADLSPIPKLYDCNIIHVNTPQSFYVQLSEDVNALKIITDRLLDAESELPPITELKTGTICAALFPEDGVYYRAEILDILPDGKYEVHYLDFGNNSITDQCRQMPADLQNMKAYALHCSLDASCPQTIEAVQHFNNILDACFSETFQLEFLKTSPTLNIVRLFYQQKNIIEKLQQLVKQVNNELNIIQQHVSPVQHEMDFDIREPSDIEET